MYSYTTTGTGENEKINADSVKYNNTAVLSSSYTYDDNGNVLTKSYGENNSIVNTYDSKDRITSTAYAGKTVNYTYDVNGQLVSANSDTYAYDSRGNITSKTVNGVTTSFTYANSGWKDLLISVDDTELEYDANGNVILYGNREFTWTYGRSLASIIDGSNEYCYTYNEDGIRTSKTVNGVTTYYNTQDGIILSQTDGTNNWYFQYDTNGTPLGFVLNGVQYFYITNQMNDVLAITDTSGTIVGNYEYDAWGKVLTADTSIAQQNPLRYRGYYYDNETGYYYLQSRYYDPSICRFINSDVYAVARITKDILSGTNTFAYCNNDPINSSDSIGLITPANIIGAIICGIVGAVGGYFLSRWLADKLGLKGAKRKIFIAGITAVITASAAAIGYFIGPYVAKTAKKVINYLKPLISKHCCFVAGTLISTPHGMQPIENIKVGDSVYSENPNTGEKGEKNVNNIFVRQTNMLYHISTKDDEILTTEEHPFWIDGVGWVAAKDLSKGDLLHLQNGEIVKIQDVFVEVLDIPVNVYNFEVKDWHTYFVGNSKILVHNKCSLTKIQDNYLKRKGFNAHEIKKEVLGNRAKISQYNLYYDKQNGAIFILKNGAKETEKIATGYFIK